MSNQWGSNRLNTTLKSGDSITIDLGTFRLEEVENGFNVLISDENDADIYDSSFSSEQIFLNDGDYLILMPPTDSITYFVQNSYNPLDYAGDEGGAPDPNDPIYQDGAESEFSYLKGNWYKDEDVSSDFFLFDDKGNWSLYVRTPGDAEGMLMDKGYVEQSPESDSFLFLISDMEGDRYDFFHFDIDIATISLSDTEVNSYVRIR